MITHQYSLTTVSFIIDLFSVKPQFGHKDLELLYNSWGGMACGSSRGRDGWLTSSLGSAQRGRLCLFEIHSHYFHSYVNNQRMVTCVLLWRWTVSWPILKNGNTAKVKCMELYCRWIQVSGWMGNRRAATSRFQKCYCEAERQKGNRCFLVLWRNHLCLFIRQLFRPFWRSTDRKRPSFCCRIWQWRLWLETT